MVIYDELSKKKYKEVKSISLILYFQQFQDVYSVMSHDFGITGLTYKLKLRCTTSHPIKNLYIVWCLCVNYIRSCVLLVHHRNKPMCTTFIPVNSV